MSGDEVLEKLWAGGLTTFFDFSPSPPAAVILVSPPANLSTFSINSWSPVWTANSFWSLGRPYFPRSVFKHFWANVILKRRARTFWLGLYSHWGIFILNLWLTMIDCFPAWFETRLCLRSRQRFWCACPSCEWRGIGAGRRERSRSCTECHARAEGASFSRGGQTPSQPWTETMLMAWK